MMKLNSKWYKYFIGILSLGLCMVLEVHAQGRGGGGGGFGGGGGGFGGGFGGGGRGGTSANSVTRQYPASGTIPDAYFSIDPETRRVVIIAPEEAMPHFMQVLTNLDRPKPQVLINVVFVEVTRNNSLDVGLEGGWTKSIGSSAGNPTTGNGSDVLGLGGLNTISSNLSLNALGQPVSSFQSTASSVAGGNAGMFQLLNKNYQLTLRAIAQAGNAKILSRPTILARNNQPASINIGQNVPLITSVSYNGLTGTPINAFTYEPVGVILNVTPFITSDGMVEMMVAPTVSSIDPTTSIPISAGVTAPVINTRTANTVAVTPDGQTVVLGGLMQTTKLTTDTKIPLLGDIPLLGNLFKRKVRNDVQTELIIFLTPHIIPAPTQLAAVSAAERAKSTATDSLSEQELSRFLDTLPPKDAPKPGAAPTNRKSKSGKS